MMKIMIRLICIISVCGCTEIANDDEINFSMSPIKTWQEDSNNVITFYDSMTRSGFHLIKSKNNRLTGIQIMMDSISDVYTLAFDTNGSVRAKSCSGDGEVLSYYQYNDSGLTDVYIKDTLISPFGDSVALGDIYGCVLFVPIYKESAVSVHTSQPYSIKGSQKIFIGNKEFIKNGFCAINKQANTKGWNYYKINIRLKEFTKIDHVQPSIYTTEYVVLDSFFVY